jgi:hypothetical protein
MKKLVVVVFCACLLACNSSSEKSKNKLKLKSKSNKLSLYSQKSGCENLCETAIFDISNSLSNRKFVEVRKEKKNKLWLKYGKWENWFINSKKLFESKVSLKNGFQSSPIVEINSSNLVLCTFKNNNKLHLYLYRLKQNNLSYLGGTIEKNFNSKDIDIFCADNNMFGFFYTKNNQIYSSIFNYQNGKINKLINKSLNNLVNNTDQINLVGNKTNSKEIINNVTNIKVSALSTRWSKYNALNNGLKKNRVSTLKFMIIGVDFKNNLIEQKLKLNFIANKNGISLEGNTAYDASLLKNNKYIAEKTYDISIFDKGLIFTSNNKQNETTSKFIYFSEGFDKFNLSQNNQIVINMNSPTINETLNEERISKITKKYQTNLIGQFIPFYKTKRKLR